MKTLTIIFITILISFTTAAQTTISVPQYPDSVKHKVAVSLCWNNVLMAVNFAKSQGMTVEEYGKYAGQQAIPYWNKDMEFKQFAYNFIGSWVIMSKGVEILSQTDNNIVFRIAKVYPMIEEQGSFVGVTFKELITYMSAILAYNNLKYGKMRTWKFVNLDNNKCIHALTAGLFNETDLEFLSGSASGITTDLISDWNNVYSCGNHLEAGYLTELRKLTINGNTSDFTTDRTWKVGTITSINTTNGIEGGPITNSGTIGLTGLGLALHNLDVNGLIVRTGNSNFAGRTIEAGSGVKNMLRQKDNITI
jgi:hypothetical protein